MMLSTIRIKPFTSMIILFILHLLNEVAHTVDIEIPDASYSCASHEFVVDDETSYVLRYKGEDPGAGGCRYKFKGNNAIDHYKLCAQLEDLYFTAGFYLEIYEGESNSPKKTYTALSDNDPHYKKHPVCAEGEKDLSVKIDADDYFTDGLNKARRKEPSKAYFRLRITGVKTLDFSATYGPLIGGVVAVIVIFAIIIAIGLFVYHRRKKYSGSVQRPSKE